VAAGVQYRGSGRGWKWRQSGQWRLGRDWNRSSRTRAQSAQADVRGHKGPGTCGRRGNLKWPVAGIMLVERSPASAAGRAGPSDPEAAAARPATCGQGNRLGQHWTGSPTWETPEETHRRLGTGSRGPTGGSRPTETRTLSTKQGKQSVRTWKKNPSLQGSRLYVPTETGTRNLELDRWGSTWGNRNYMGQVRHARALNSGQRMAGLPSRRPPQAWVTRQPSSHWEEQAEVVNPRRKEGGRWTQPAWNQ
jgi:hypothetical protein